VSIRLPPTQQHPPRKIRAPIPATVKFGRDRPAFFGSDTIKVIKPKK
jgi:hypothetical protein